MLATPVGYEQPILTEEEFDSIIYDVTGSCNMAGFRHIHDELPYTVARNICEMRKSIEALAEIAGAEYDELDSAYYEYRSCLDFITHTVGLKDTTRSDIHRLNEQWAHVIEESADSLNCSAACIEANGDYHHYYLTIRLWEKMAQEFGHSMDAFGDAILLASQSKLMTHDLRPHLVLCERN